MKRVLCRARILTMRMGRARSPTQAYSEVDVRPTTTLCAASSKDLAEQKLFETRRKGMHTPTAYIQYVEVWARPDNDVSKKHLRDAGAFCGRTIYARETRENMSRYLSHFSNS